MINILELVYGSELAPDSSPIHIFNPDRDLYEHAEFAKPNGDFYQIVKVSNQLTLYHFQKDDAGLLAEKLLGNWWMRHAEITRKYENRGEIFYEKISDRLLHEYNIVKLVITQGHPLNIRANHPDYEKVMNVYGRY